ncbi:MAG: hypothetical protein ICV51_09885 [Flavisolibacter sp.]|nr:hypothetical protein [Flavisolibacter sp.]
MLRSLVKRHNDGWAAGTTGRGEEKITPATAAPANTPSKILFIFIVWYYSVNPHARD